MSCAKHWSPSKVCLVLGDVSISTAKVLRWKSRLAGLKQKNTMSVIWKVASKKPKETQVHILLETYCKTTNHRFFPPSSWEYGLHPCRRIISIESGWHQMTRGILTPIVELFVIPRNGLTYGWWWLEQGFCPTIPSIILPQPQVGNYMKSFKSHSIRPNGIQGLNEVRSP